MNQRMLHRGPDMQDYWCSEDHSIVLGHVRLSILDLSEAGKQPVQSQDGRYVMVWNGEIYNYESLRKKLVMDGRQLLFRGHSDTEVLIEYVAAYGLKEALKASTGMFAAAVFDRRTKKLCLCRDRMGEKPLYYGFLDSGFVFASDIGCIAEIAENSLEISRDALAVYLRHGYIPAPYTIYKNIYKAEAGSVVELPAPYDRPRIQKYWNVMRCARHGEKNLFAGSEKEAADHLEGLLKKSIQLQMQADVPVGAFLSGGIDSTTVTAVMQSLARGRVKTFSIGFEEHAYNEAAYAKETARYLGTDHTELYVTAKDVMDVIPKMAHIYSEPFADSSQLPMYLVSRLAKQSVTVSLSGDGGDELFCGYGSYSSVQRIWNMIKYVPYPLRHVTALGLGKIRNADHIRLNLLKNYLGRKSIESIYANHIDASADISLLSPEENLPPYKFTEYPSGYLTEDPVKNVMLMDMLMYLPDDILAKVDRAAMAVSLETRVPLLDKDIVEFAWTLPQSYKADGNQTKKVLRNVLYRYVPQSMMERPKKGFSIPVADWIRNGRLQEWAGDMLAESRIRKEGILDSAAVRKLWDGFLKDGRGAVYIWYLLMFEEWMHKVYRKKK